MSADNNETRIPNWKKIIYFAFHSVFIFLIGTGFIFAHDMITHTEEFSIKSVKVSGNYYLDNDDVIRIAGLNNYANLFDANISVARLKLENSPWIKKASVKRSLPDSIEIKVIEQKPYAKINFKDDFILNDQGILFKKFEKDDENLNIPEITGLSYMDLSDKNYYFSLLMDILKKNTLFLKADSRIHLDKDIGITLYNTDSFNEIVLGFTDLDKKIKNIGIVKLYVKQKFNDMKIEKIDLTNKNRVVLKPFPAMG